MNEKIKLVNQSKATKELKSERRKACDVKANDIIHLQFSDTLHVASEALQLQEFEKECSVGVLHHLMKPQAVARKLFICIKLKSTSPLQSIIVYSYKNN